jgi:hypothetical protein
MGWSLLKLSSFFSPASLVVGKVWSTISPFLATIGCCECGEEWLNFGTRRKVALIDNSLFSF